MIEDLPRSRTARVARAMRGDTVAALAVLGLAAMCGCGGSGARSAPRAVTSPGGTGARAGPVFGLTEDNAALLWSPEALSRAPAGAARRASLGAQRFQLAREELSALQPGYVRVLVDWAALQPDPGRPPALEARLGGCARAIGPCVAYAGVREEFAAIASQQRARGAATTAAGPGFQVVIDIFGTPPWAARPAAGCERGGEGSFSHAPSAPGLAAYRRLIHALIALAAREGVALNWWAPWNEPNDPAFLSPQRSSCAADAAPLSPSSYAELTRAMAAQLRAEGGDRHLLLGELNAYQSGAADRTSIAQFVAALPADVLCLSDVWAIHAYASRAPFAPARDPVRALEAALDGRGGCARGTRIWVTEAGAGAPHPGDSRPPGPGEERAACRALAGQLLDWYRDPRVSAVFQYTFRDDPAYPVGLVDPALSRPYPAYGLWLQWVRARAAGVPPPSAGTCSA